MNIHVFIDAENMPPTPALATYDLLTTEHNVYCCDVVGKLNTLSTMYKSRQSRYFHLRNSDFGKNSADLWMTVYIARAIFEEPYLDLIAIFSNDRDFAAVVDLAVEKKKQVLIMVMESQVEAISKTLAMMKINRDFVTVGSISDIKPEPEFISIKVHQLPKGEREYFKGRYKNKTIFVKRGEQFLELPFIDGMHLNQFVHIMRHYKIWNKSQKLDKGVKNLSLKIANNRVWYQSEEEMLK